MLLGDLSIDSINCIHVASALSRLTNEGKTFLQSQGLEYCMNVEAQPRRDEMLSDPCVGLLWAKVAKLQQNDLLEGALFRLPLHILSQ